MNTKEYCDLLDACLRNAQANTHTQSSPHIPDSLRKHIDNITDGQSKAPLAVLLTSLVKKAITPTQDIRMHRTDLADGYSGRSLDTKIVTPFLEENGFPYMKSGSGWLTRSFEQSHPYDLEYPGQISGTGIKDAFLKSIDSIERRIVDPESLIVYVLQRLLKRRDRENVVLSRPTNMTISEIIHCLDAHFSSGGSGKSRLPVLAIHAVYKQMIGGGGAAGKYNVTKTCVYKI